VIPARAAAKVSMRLVPGQEPLEIAELFDKYLRTLAPVLAEYSHPFQQSLAFRAITQRGYRS